MSKINYVPAGLDNFINDESISLFQYLETDYFLVNYVALKNITSEKLVEYKKQINNFNKKILIDSGGFQLISDPKLYLDPKKIFDFQQQFGDIGFILDVPLFNKEINNGIASLIPITNEEKINERLQLTINNINAIKNLDKKNCNLYLIIHGNNPSEYYKWFEATKNLYPFDGISLKTKTIPQLIMSFFTIYKHGYKNIHALGTSALNIIPLFYYIFNQTNFETITYDSSNSLQYSVNKRMLFDIIYLRNKCIYITQSNIKKSSCNCKMCQAVKFDIGEYCGKQEHSANFYTNQLTVHNTNVMNKYNDFINMLSDDKQVLKEWTINSFPETKIWFEIIDKCFEECNKSGDPFYKIFDEKLQQYHPYFLKNGAQGQQSNIFNF